jgi:hypothetical protein
MDKELFKKFDDIPWPPRGDLKFVNEIKAYEETASPRTRKIWVKTPELLPLRAKISLERHFIPDETGLPLTLVKDEKLAAEEFILEVTAEAITITAAGDSGFRYGVCELEERFAGRDFSGTIRRKPWVKHRISRCFFAPNTRPPLKLDELTDDQDYYPEAYLDRIMHERLNGVWLTLYLNDMPCSFFPERGKDAEQRLAKLKKVAERCAQYGIKCYIFMAEPRSFEGAWKSNTREELQSHPELGSISKLHGKDVSYFCTTSPEGKQYITETVGYIFSRVPELGGIINIMSLESSHPCAERKLYAHVAECQCPRCAPYSGAELYAEMARTFNNAMKKYAPEAEFFGWYYSAFHMPGEPENKVVQETASLWPDDCTLLYNCETGGENQQCGRTMIVQDYSLSWAGPSNFWKNLASRTKKIAAKMQTGVSHEDATVPYFPVPDILFERYQGLHAAGNCEAVMQCWYFGSVPSIMNRAAGRLSFNPMPASDQEFLLELAAPVWGEHAENVAQAWKAFSLSYRNFPECIAFKWAGPLHFSIVYPWYVYPADLPIAPSYTQAFPKNSGDRIGECVGYAFTFAEIRSQLKAMDELWQKGMELLAPCADTELRKKELYVAEAIGLQFASSRRLFEFYYLRDDMIFNGNDNISAMKELVAAELEATLRMAELCKLDTRLGYHSEVESYCFFPEKLYARAELLRDAAKDLENYDMDSEAVRNYRLIAEKTVPLSSLKEWQKVGEVEFKAAADEKNFVFTFRNIPEPVRLDLEPGRLCRVIDLRVLTPEKHNHDADFLPGVTFDHNNGVVTVTVERKKYEGFRVSDRMPWRFNISTPSGALSPLHLWRPRLCQGDCNPGDLLYLDSEQ